MATITSAGIGSGLDINGLVTQLVEAEKQVPADRLDRRQADLQLRLSSYGLLKSNLSSFASSLSGLKTASTYTSFTSVSSDKDIFTASSSGLSSNASYSINVTALAENHKLSTDPSLAGAKFTDVTDTLSTGTLTFKFGSTTYNADTDSYTGFVQNPDKAAQTVTITDNSLEGVRDAINDANIGVNAALIFDGTNYRLTLSSADTGANNSLEITVSDDDGFNDDASGLSLLAFNAAANHLEQNGAAADAALTLNGIGITSASNTVTGSIDGISLKLKTTGSATLDVAADTGKVKTAVTDFVASYNNYISTVNRLTSYNPDTGEAGQLNGDGITRSITSNIQRLIGNPVGGAGSTLRILAEIGITTNTDDGSLKVDQGKLDKQLADNFDKFAVLFSAFGETANAQTKFIASTTATEVGQYAVNITSLATQGKLVGSAAANLTISAGGNDEIALKIKGVTGTITLGAGTYTAAELAVELKTKINDLDAFKNAGVSVDVTESAGVLSLLSKAYGSSSKVEITGGNGQTDLIGASPTQTDGVDVVGTIGGVAATGNGQLLTGTGKAAGLAIEITGVALGDRGVVDFNRGYADRIGTYLNSILGTNGLFESTTTSLEGGLDIIADERRALADKIVSLEKRLRIRYGALDALVAQLQNTSSFLTQQLESLPKIGSKR